MQRTFRYCGVYLSVVTTYIGGYMALTWPRTTPYSAIQSVARTRCGVRRRTAAAPITSRPPSTAPPSVAEVDRAVGERSILIQARRSLWHPLPSRNQLIAGRSNSAAV